MGWFRNFCPWEKMNLKPDTSYTIYLTFSTVSTLKIAAFGKQVLQTTSQFFVAVVNPETNVTHCED